jgi:transketolase
MELISLRDVYGDTLVKLGAENKDIVVLDADLAVSTKSIKFASVYNNRFFDVGIAEQNMVCIAAGLALAGKIPFVNSFSFLLSMRTLDQIRTSIAYPGLKVIFVGASSGLSDSYDGPTHHSLCDISIFRSLPGMKVIVASDGISTKSMLKESLKWEGPVFLRLSRASTPNIHDDNYKFLLGKGEILTFGDDITIITNGIMTHKVLQAQKVLIEMGIQTEIIEMSSVKPLDSKLILESVAKTKAVLTVEEHNIIGGLGSAVAEVLSEAGIGKPHVRIGVNDTFTETGDYEELLRKYGLCLDNIVDNARKLLNK